MARGGSILRLRVIFDGFVVIASIIAGIVTGILLPILLIVALVSMAGIVSYIEHKNTRIKPRNEALLAVIEEHVLPKLVEEYESVHPDEPPAIRANVMLLRRRNVIPFRRARRDVWPWQRTLRIEASLGDYESRSEDELEWKPNEGAVGRAMNQSAQEMWAPLDYDETDRLKVGWNLTEAQVSRTDHLGSLLCVPIYLASDEEKVEPAGVLNLDSEEPLDVSGFGDENVRRNAIKSANLIGAIIE